MPWDGLSTARANTFRQDALDAGHHAVHFSYAPSWSATLKLHDKRRDAIKRWLTSCQRVMARLQGWAGEVLLLRRSQAGLAPWLEAGIVHLLCRSSSNAVLNFEGLK